jgi:hypothetical protein
VRLHTKLADKHVSIIHMKNMDAARLSYDCLKLWTNSPWVSGRFSK